MNKNTMNMEGIDFRYLLLDFYKKLGLNENEAMVILMVDQLLRQGNDFISQSDLSFKMNLSERELDTLMAGLMQKDMLSIDSSGGRLKTSLSPIKEKLYGLFQQAIATKRETPVAARKAEAIGKVRDYFEKRLNRTLSPLEVDTIAAWLDDGYSDEDIKGGLESALANGKKTFKAVDSELRAGRKRDDIAKEGYTGVNSRWNKDIERTIEIARTKWVEDDD